MIESLQKMIPVFAAIPVGARVWRESPVQASAADASVQVVELEGDAGGSRFDGI
jgi:hypothetical protein